ncbi:MAG: radical SAM protein [Myxococcota bacterium]|nr:radical SAM protein [Myxococcota bacterium]
MKIQLKLDDAPAPMPPATRGLLAETDGRVPVPPVVCWLVTGRCNLRCIHCQPESAPDYGGPELDFEELMNAVPGLARSGVKIVLLTGGEPFVLRSRLYALIESILSHDMKIWINTNGVLIDEAAADRIAGYGLEGLIVALDSGDAAIHDCFRAREGSHAKALRAIRLLRERDVNVNVNYVASRMTRVHIEKLQPLLNEMGVTNILVNRFRPFGRANENLEALAISQKEYLETVEDLIASYQGPGAKLSFEDPTVYAYLRSNASVGSRDGIQWDGGYAVVGCQAGIVNLGILPNGDVTPCAFLHVPIGNIAEDDLDVIVNRSGLLRRILDRDDRGGKCGGCEKRWQCGGCRAHAFAASGDALAEDPFCVAPCGAHV